MSEDLLLDNRIKNERIELINEILGISSEFKLNELQESFINNGCSEITFEFYKY